MENSARGKTQLTSNSHVTDTFRAVTVVAFLFGTSKLLPALLPTSVSHQSLSGESQRFFFTRLAHSCQIYAIRLAACIWETVVRHHLSVTLKPDARGTLVFCFLLSALY
jgi:hypothetical protein